MQEQQHSYKEIAYVYQHHLCAARISWIQEAVAKPDMHISVTNLTFQCNNYLYFGVEYVFFYKSGYNFCDTATFFVLLIKLAFSLKSYA